MAVITHTLEISTKGNCDIIDITDNVAHVLTSLNVSAGTVTIFVPGATGGVTTIEYESGALRDLKEAFDRMAPSDIHYQHNERWHDGNGHSHVRAALLGPSLSVPFQKKRLILGTWQQIIFVDFDVRSRRREIILQIMGE